MHSLLWWAKWKNPYQEQYTTKAISIMKFHDLNTYDLPFLRI